MVPVKYPSRRTQKYAAICSYEGSPPLVLVDSKSEIKEGTAHAMAGLIRKETDADILEIATLHGKDFVEPSASIDWKTQRQ